MNRILKLSFFTLAVVTCLGLTLNTGNVSAQITTGGGGVPPVKPPPPKPPAPPKPGVPAKPAVDDKGKTELTDPYDIAKKEFDDAEAERRKLEDEMNDLKKREEAGEDIRGEKGTWKNKARDAKKKWRKAKKEWDKQGKKKKYRARYKLDEVKHRLELAEAKKKKIKELGEKEKDKKKKKKLHGEFKKLAGKIKGLKARLGRAEEGLEAELKKKKKKKRKAGKAKPKIMKIVNDAGEDCMEVELAMLQEAVQVTFNNINEERIAAGRLKLFLTGPHDNQRVVEVKKDVATGRYRAKLGEVHSLDGYMVSVVTEGASAGAVPLGTVSVIRGDIIIAAASGTDDKVLISSGYGKALKKGLITYDQAKDMMITDVGSMTAAKVLEPDPSQPSRASVGSGQIGLGDNNKLWDIQYGQYGAGSDQIRRMPTSVRENAPLMNISIDCTYFKPDCEQKQNVVK